MNYVQIDRGPVPPKTNNQESFLFHMREHGYVGEDEWEVKTVFTYDGEIGEAFSIALEKVKTADASISIQVFYNNESGIDGEYLLSIHTP